MFVLTLNAREGLYYELDQASRAGAPTFVFVNAITGDLKCLVEELKIERPILVGLSIGGLYAAKAYLAGLRVEGLVLINTLRKIGPRLDWMNAATLRLMQVAGPNLMRDVMTPLLFGPNFLEAHRHEFLEENTAYDPLPADGGPINLITWMGKTDWEIDYSQLSCPVLVMMGPNDRIFYDAAIVDELHATLPNARRHDVAEAGHMLPVECPAAFVAAVTAFANDMG